MVKVLFRGSLGGKNRQVYNEVYESLLKEALGQSREFILANYNLFGVPKNTKTPTIVFYHWYYALPSQWTLLLNYRSSDNYVPLLHETAHLLHYRINPQIWANSAGEFQLGIPNLEGSIREMVAETAAIHHLNNLGILQRAIELKQLEMPCSRLILREYARLEGGLPRLIRAKSIEEALEIPGVDRQFLEKIKNIRG